MRRSRWRIAGRALAVWLLLMAVEVLHGTFRTLVLSPRLGDMTARQLSVFTGSALVLLITWLTHSWRGARSNRALLLTGLGWVALTVLFEIALGHWAFQYSWERIWADYNMGSGSLMPLGLLLMALAPLLMARLRRVQTPPQL